MTSAKNKLMLLNTALINNVIMKSSYPKFIKDQAAAEANKSIERLSETEALILVETIRRVVNQQ
jgi:hypothetical protein